MIQYCYITELRVKILLSQGLLGVSDQILEDLVRTPLTGSNSIQGILTVGPPLWILSWPGGRRSSRVEARAVGWHPPSGRNRLWRMMMAPKDPGIDTQVGLRLGLKVYVRMLRTLSRQIRFFVLKLILFLDFSSLGVTLLHTACERVDWDPFSNQAPTLGLPIRLHLQLALKLGPREAATTLITT